LARLGRRKLARLNLRRLAEAVNYGDYRWLHSCRDVDHGGAALAGVRAVFIGVGLPNIACNLAITVAPTWVDLRIQRVRGSVAAVVDYRPLVTSAVGVSMADLFGLICSATW
jgi:hypothetical protein